MDEDPDYRPGDRYSPWGTGREGGRCGCLAALLFALPVGFGVLIGATLGNCMNDASCEANRTTYMLAGFAIALALAALFGLAIRVLVRWWRLRGTDAAPGLWSLAWSIPVALTLGAIAIWAELEMAAMF